MTNRRGVTIVGILIGTVLAVVPHSASDARLFAQARGDCRCPNVNAYSTPADEKDLCSRGETNGACSLKWNLPTGGHRAAFDEAIKRLKPGAQVVPSLEFSALCAGRPGNGPWCPWIEFLKRDDLYGARPETAGVGFLAMVFVAFEMGPQQERDRAALVLNEAGKARALGEVLAKGGDWQTDNPRYHLRANFGCLSARALPVSVQTVVIQNSRGRIEGTCAQ